MGKINHKKVEIDGHLFDSTTEAEYYLHLKEQPDIKRIELQPQFTFINPFNIQCGRCDSGKVASPKTGNLVNCKTCKGTGTRKRQGWTYTSDFRVTYKNGKVEVIDVKGFVNERFPLVRKMFEHQYNRELLVVKKTKNGWKYV